MSKTDNTPAKKRKVNVRQKKTSTIKKSRADIKQSKIRPVDDDIMDVCEDGVKVGEISRSEIKDVVDKLKMAVSYMKQNDIKIRVPLVDLDYHFSEDNYFSDDGSGSDDFDLDEYMKRVEKESQQRNDEIFKRLMAMERFM